MTQTDDARSARVRWLGSIAWRWFEPQIALAAPRWCPICLAAAAKVKEPHAAD